MALPSIGNEPAVNVASATDEQFQAVIAHAGIPVEDGGIVEWSFDDRLDVLCHALTYGLIEVSADGTRFVFPNKNNSLSELFDPCEVPQEARQEQLV